MENKTRNGFVRSSFGANVWRFYSSSVMIHVPFRCDPSRRMLPVSFSFATSRLTVACETESFSPYALYVKLGF